MHIRIKLPEGSRHLMKIIYMKIKKLYGFVHLAGKYKNSFV